MKLGVICDGVSRDLAYAVDVMDEFDLRYAELQFVGDTEVGDHSAQEIRDIDMLLRDRGKPVSCLSRHVFAGMTVSNRPGDALHMQHMDALKRVIEMAHIVDSPLVRIMTQKKEQILWGHNGAEKWNVAHGAWDTTAPLIAPAVDLARSEGVTLVVETGNGTMVNSNYTARKLIDELNARDVLKVLWDPANNCWCHELAYPDGYILMATLRCAMAIWAMCTSKMCRLIPRGQRWTSKRWAKGNLVHYSHPWQMRCGTMAMMVSFRLRAFIILGTAISKQDFAHVSRRSKQFLTCNRPG